MHGVIMKKIDFIMSCPNLEQEEHCYALQHIKYKRLYTHYTYYKNEFLDAWNVFRLYILHMQY